MKSTLCERVAAPLLALHHKTTPVASVVLMGMVGLGLMSYGVATGRVHLAWAGALVALTSWYGFLLSGCARLLAAKEVELGQARSVANRVE